MDNETDGITRLTIYRIGNGWYDFKDIPQGYIKIHGLNCGDDKKAFERAKKICDSQGIKYNKGQVIFEIV